MSSLYLDQGRLILPAAVESGGVKYDISIGFHLEGLQIDAGMPLERLSPEIKRIVLGCLDSLQEQLAKEGRARGNLEELGFRVESGAGSGKAAETAVLVAGVGNSVLRSLEEGKAEEIKDTHIDTNALALAHNTVSQIYGNVSNRTVHEALLHLQGLFQNDFILGIKRDPSPSSRPGSDFNLTPGPAPATDTASENSDQTFYSVNDFGSEGPSEDERLARSDDEDLIDSAVFGGALRHSDPNIVRKRKDLLQGALDAFKTADQDERSLVGRYLFNQPWQNITLLQLLRRSHIPAGFEMQTLQKAFCDKAKGKEVRELNLLYEKFHDIAWPFYENLWAESKQQMDRMVSEHKQEDDDSPVTDVDRKAYAWHMFQRDFIKELEKSWK